MGTRLANVMSCSTFGVVHVRDSLKERNARHCANESTGEFCQTTVREERIVALL